MSPVLYPDVLPARPLCVDAREAALFYQKARQAAEQGQLEQAEIYYLQSIGCYEESGSPQSLNTANAWNALACLWASGGDPVAALAAAKQALQILERGKLFSADAQLIRDTAWELIELTRPG